MRKNADRPLTRVLIKLVCSVAFGRARAHYQSWLPGLSLALPQQGDDGEIRYKGKRVATLFPSDIMLLSSQSSEIVIIGSGPSVSNAAVETLVPRTAFLLNGAISLISTYGIVPFAIAIEDERFVWRHFEAMKACVSGDVTTLMSPAVIRAVCELDPAWLANKRIVLINDIRKPYRAKKRSSGELSNLSFVRISSTGAGASLCPDQGVFQGGSVAITAFQFAISRRPSKIGFLGVDINNAKMPRFYERVGEQAYSGIATAKQRILDHLHIGLTVAAEQGVEVVTYSAISALREIGISYDQRLAIS
jgi:hypothetical protein